MYLYLFQESFLDFIYLLTIFKALLERNVRGEEKRKIKTQKLSMSRSKLSGKDFAPRRSFLVKAHDNKCMKASLAVVSNFHKRDPHHSIQIRTVSSQPLLSQGLSQHGCQECLAPAEFLDSNVWHPHILAILLHKVV